MRHTSFSLFTRFSSFAEQSEWYRFIYCVNKNYQHHLHLTKHTPHFLASIETQHLNHSYTSLVAIVFFCFIYNLFLQKACIRVIFATSISQTSTRGERQFYLKQISHNIIFYVNTTPLLLAKSLYLKLHSSSNSTK